MSEFSLDNIDGDVDPSPSQPEASAPEIPATVAPLIEPASVQPERRDVVPLPDYSIPHDDFRALAAAQSAHAERVKLEQLAIQHPEVRALLAQRDELAKARKPRK